MADSEIRNVEKDDGDNITHVGVKNSWKWTVPQTVASIENRENTFFVMCPQRADVYVAQVEGRKFLKTRADTTTRNNLDSLPGFD